MDPTERRPDQAPDQTPSTAPDTAPPAWQSTPQPTGTQPPAAGTWAAPASTAGTPGPAGYVYGDVPNRIIAYIIDVVILVIVFIIVGIVLGAIVGQTMVTDPTSPNFGQVNFGAAIIFAIVNAIISGAYFVYTWTSMRGTLGMRALGMQVGNETDGATLTLNQAITRWALLFGPGAIAQAFGFSGIGLILNLVALVWWIALLVTTAQSPTKQGLHDRYAHTVVVKATRSVA
jgi:uncharacterized RDD family membrane protein YckC